MGCVSKQVFNKLLFEPDSYDQPSSIIATQGNILSKSMNHPEIWHKINYFPLLFIIPYLFMSSSLESTLFLSSSQLKLAKI